MSTANHDSLQEELADLLKRCSAETLTAATAFREKGDLSTIEPIVLGIIDRHLEPDQKKIFQDAQDNLRLYEDLGLDSLTMLEIVMLVEQVLNLSIDNEELRDLRTLGDVKQYLDAKVRGVDLPARAKTYRIEEVASVMPHREPFLFLESVTVDGEEARGDYTITGNEYFLEGHFKNQPVFPASIMIEALGQLCVFYLLKSEHSSIAEKVNPSTIFFTACDGIKCRRVCKPGDVLSMVIKPSRIRHPLACFSGEITVNGERTAQAGEIKLAFDYYPIMDASADVQAESNQVPENASTGISLSQEVPKETSSSSAQISAPK